MRNRRVLIVTVTFAFAAGLVALAVEARFRATAKMELAHGGLQVDEQAFISSVRSGDNEAVKRFLAAGISPDTRDSRDSENSNVLMVAAMAGQDEVLRTLIAAGAETDARTQKGRTALSWAAWGGQTATARDLLTSGVNVNVSDKSGSTPLSFAISHHTTDTTKALLDNGSATNTQHNPP